ncbi:hypothetical protein BH10BDE1_BH10BDE1_17840 [soil metagenome]
MGPIQYVELLKSKFEERKKRNQRYSLRAYSRFLGLDAGTMSAILRGRRPLSRLKAQQIVSRLKLSNDEKRGFYLSLMSRHQVPQEFVAERHGVQCDDVHDFLIISEWEYAAALCLMDLSTFRLSVASLRERLKISKRRADVVLKTLVTSGLVELGDSRYCRRDRNFSTSEDVKSTALERAHSEGLKMAARKLRALDVIDRDFSSITIAARSRRLGEMKTMIRQFRKEFEARFESSDGDCVFNLALQLYPISEKTPKGAS